MMTEHARVEAENVRMEALSDDERMTVALIANVLDPDAFKERPPATSERMARIRELQLSARRVIAIQHAFRVFEWSQSDD